MRFRARREAPVLARLLAALWPRAGLRRTGLYYAQRIQRIRGSPHRLALGFAWGAAFSMTPFVGLHGVAAVVLAWVTRGSWVTALIGTLAGNPWTFPFIWIATFQIGSALYPGDIPTGFSPAAIGNEILLAASALTSLVVLWNPGRAAESLAGIHLIPVMALGSVPLALAAGLGSYFGVRALVVRYRRIREARRAARLAAAGRSRARAPAAGAGAQAGGGT